MSGKNWTTSELRIAAKLWSDGLTIVDIANRLCRTRESIKHISCVQRSYFPRRREKRGSQKDTAQLKLEVSKFLLTAIRKAAKDRGISINMLLRETLRDKFVRRT